MAETMHTKAALLEHARLRGKRCGGLVTADRYLAEMTACLNGESPLCPAQVFGKLDADTWSKELEASCTRLTFLAKEQKFQNALAAPPEESEFLLTRHCTVTTGTKDRDRDILEAEGGQFHARALLWQHVTMLPIGSVWGATAGKNAIGCDFGIVPCHNGLGEDAAKLVKVGALQISHGFEPLDFTPLKGEDEGWHIKTFEIMEVSLVSVPANREAVIELGEADKFVNPLVKQWSKSLAASRPLKVSVPAAVGRCSESMQHETYSITVTADSAEALRAIKSTLASAGKDGQTSEPQAESGDKDGPLTCPKCGYAGGAGEFMEHDRPEEGADKANTPWQKAHSQHDSWQYREIRTRRVGLWEGTHENTHTPSVKQETSPMTVSRDHALESLGL